MLCYPMVYDTRRDMAEMTCSDGEDGVPNEGVRFGQRDDLLAEWYVEYFVPVLMQMVHEIDTGCTILGARGRKWDNSDGTQGRECVT